jgi:hypothetical protein
MASRVLFLTVIVFALLLDRPPSSNAEVPPVTDHRLYLPFVPQPDRFGETPAIWSAAATPAAPHEVVFFRHRFTLAEPLPLASVHLFADTRYDLWLNGQWLGRGPARFSSSYT